VAGAAATTPGGSSKPSPDDAPDSGAPSASCVELPAVYAA